MKLLSEKELIWSDVVANNNMNRKRKASGVNSYQKELNCKLELFLDACLARRGQVKWLDLCCGEGNALLQYAHEVAARSSQHQVLLTGIDLVDAFRPIPHSISCLRFEVQSLIDWFPVDRYDLITCVHGLHYVGDKMLVLDRMLKTIADDGILLANIDAENIKIENDIGHKWLKALFKTNHIEYNSRRKLLSCKGPRDISIPLIYQGADDKAGPNYTGQHAVDSYYLHSGNTI